LSDSNNEYSKELFLKISNQNPTSKIKLTSPTNLEDLSSTTVKFNWNQDPNKSESYVFQLSESKSFQNLIADSTITDTLITIRNLNNNSQYFWRVKGKNIFGEGDWSDIGMFKILNATDLENEEKAYKFTLKQNYPNPFNPSTTIRYSLANASDVRLTVFNMIGQKVATLVNQPMNAGSYTAQFDASALSSGMYFYRLDAGEFSETKKMLLVK